jgi:hypothetical protein
MIPVKIYALIDPRNKTPFYVGATKLSLRTRLRCHLSDAKKYNKSGDICLKRVKKIKSILNKGLLPVIELL